MRNLIDGRRARKADHDNRGVSRDLSGVRGDYDVGLCQLVSPRCIYIEGDDAPAAIDKIAGNRASHDAKSNDSNSLVHASSLPAC
jgi:hypothetical protein